MVLGELQRAGTWEQITDRGLSLSSTVPVSPLARVALLTLLAGYAQTDDIRIAAPELRALPVRRLERFLSYSINHPHFTPRQYQLKLHLPTTGRVTMSRETARTHNPIVSVFSGGLDSTAGLLLLRSSGYLTLPVFISYEQKNNEAERHSAELIARQLKLPLQIVRLNLGTWISAGWAAWNYIIPGRNLLFITLAESFLPSTGSLAGKIYVCAHKDEMSYRRNRDKSRYFFKQASYFISAERQQAVQVTTPFARYDKTQVLAYWKRAWGRYGVEPKMTVTCYYGRGCGRCEACLKRTIHLLAAGWPEDPWMEMHPFRGTAKIVARTWLDRIANRRFPAARVLDLMIATERSSVKWPHSLQPQIEALARRRRSAIAQRKLDLARVKVRL